MLKAIAEQVIFFITEFLALLKQRFTSVIESVQNIVKAIAPEWRLYVITHEDEEKIYTILLGGELTHTIGDAYTFGKAVQSEVAMLIVD